MGWGIWKKIKQGLSKVAQFGKKALKTVIDKAPDIISKSRKIIDSGVADAALQKLKIDKGKLNQVLDKGEAVVNFAGRRWQPQLKN